MTTPAPAATHRAARMSAPAPAQRRPGEQRTLLLSIVMPAYNEERTIAAALDAILALELPCEHELIVVDDGSDDATEMILLGYDDPRLRMVRHDANRGKGAAVRTGITLARGTHVLVFDADLEYRSDDVVGLLTPVIDGAADVVYGCRTLSSDAPRPAARFRIGNRIMTGIANLLYATDVRDIHTCLKLVPREMLVAMRLRESGFGLDTEITGSLLRNGIVPVEVAVSYRPRSKADGKKIGWRDGVRCLSLLTRIRLRPRREFAAVSSQPSTYELMVFGRRAAEDRAGAA